MLLSVSICKYIVACLRHGYVRGGGGGVALQEREGGGNSLTACLPYVPPCVVTKTLVLGASYSVVMVEVVHRRAGGVIHRVRSNCLHTLTGAPILGMGRSRK